MDIRTVQFICSESPCWSDSSRQDSVMVWMEISSEEFQLRWRLSWILIRTPLHVAVLILQIAWYLPPSLWPIRQMVFIFICVWTFSYALYLHMWSVDALVWLYTCAYLPEYPLVAYMIRTNSAYHSPALSIGSVVGCATWDLDVPDLSLTQLLFCVLSTTFTLTAQYWLVPNTPIPHKPRIPRIATNW